MLACEKDTQDDRMIDLHSIFVTVEQENFLNDASRAISLAKNTFKLHNDHYQGQLLQNSRALKAFISQIEGFAGIEELRRVFKNTINLDKFQIISKVPISRTFYDENLNTENSLKRTYRIGVV